MINRIANFFSKIMQRWLPDAFIFAIFLTFLVLILALFNTPHSLPQLVNFWGEGLWKLLGFSMQMVLILVAGHMLANAPLIAKGLNTLATLARTKGQAVVLVTLVAAIASWINWGFGLVVGALIAKACAQNNRDCHYPLLVAAAYSGFVLWHTGLSGSIPLKIASPDNDALGQLLQGEAIPVSQTLFSSEVLLINLILLLSLPILNLLMHPKSGIKPFPQSALSQTRSQDAEPCASSPALRVEQSKWPILLLGLLGLGYLAQHFAAQGGMSLNIVILVFLCLGLVLHKSTQSFMLAIQNAVSCVSGIVLQFPLYGGIMALMVSSGLAQQVSNLFVSISGPDSFASLTFLSAGLVNFFVPSGGGQWAVQAPIVLPAAQALDIPAAQAAIAVAYGDAWSNLIQPFWALPLLAVAGLSIRDIMGYCTLALLVSGSLIFGLLWVLY